MEPSSVSPPLSSVVGPSPSPAPSSSPFPSASSTTSSAAAPPPLKPSHFPSSTPSLLSSCFSCCITSSHHQNEEHTNSSSSSCALACLVLGNLFTYRGPNPHTSRYRFFVLGVFCLYSCSNAMQWLTYSPIPTPIRQFYGISTTQLNMFSTIYMIVYIALSVVSCLGLERIGLRWCLLIGTGLNFLGSMLKLVIGFPTDSYAVLMIAQVLNALSQIFILSVPPTLALVWFKESDRGTATTIGAAANAFGCAMGMLIPPLWVSEETDLSILSEGVKGNRDGSIADGLVKLFGFQLALCGTALFGAIFLVPSTTATPTVVASGKRQTASDKADDAAGAAEGQMRAAAGHHPLNGEANEDYDNSDGRGTNTALRIAGPTGEHHGGGGGAVVVRMLSPPSPDATSLRTMTPVHGLSEASVNPLVAPSVLSAASSTDTPTINMNSRPTYLGGGATSLYSPPVDQQLSSSPPAVGGAPPAPAVVVSPAGVALDLYSPRDVAAAIGAPATEGGGGGESTTPPPMAVVTAATAPFDVRPTAVSTLPLPPAFMNAGDTGGRTSSSSPAATTAAATGSSSSSSSSNSDGSSDTSCLGVLGALFGLARDRDNVLCVLGLSISIGSVWAVNSLLAQLLAPINISEGDAGQMGFWNIIAGTIVAVFAGPIVDRFRVYKWPIVGLAVVNLVCLSLIIMMMYLDDTNQGDAGGGDDAGMISNSTFGAGGTANNSSHTTGIVSSSNSLNSLAAVYTLNVLAGIPQNVITPIGMEFLMELSYGHPSSISGGLLMAIANAVSLVEVSIGAALLGDAPTAPKHNALNAFWLVWALLVVGLVLLVLPRNNLKRLAAQQQQEQQRDHRANEMMP